MKLLHVLSLFLAITIIGVLMSFRPQAEEAADDWKPKYIRYNVYSPEGQANLKILQDGLEIMRDPKKMDCSQPFSWYFQGGLHGAPNPTDFMNQYCGEYFLGESKGWNNCTHHNVNGSGANASLHFLSWHKIYLDHFEDAIRQLTGKPNFTIPYWKYDARDSQNRTMPKALQNRESSLYVDCRRADINKGGEVTTSFPWGHDASGNPIMIDPTSTAKAFSKKINKYIDFTNSLESVPHNIMHVYLGSGADKSLCSENLITGDKDERHDGYYTGWMSDNLSAGMDPVFWIHHANIDRIFTRWLFEKIDDDNIKIRPHFNEFENTPWSYRFYTKNDLNTLKTYTNAEAYKAGFGVRNYFYNDFLTNEKAYKNYVRKTNKAIQQELGKTAPVFALLKTSSSLAEDNIVINSNVNGFTANLTVNDNTKNLKARKSTLEDWILEIDLSFEEVPRAPLGVQITQNSKTTFVGPLTFFGAGHKHGERHSTKLDKGIELEKKIEKHFRFHIDDELDTSSFPSDVKVTITGDPGKQIIIDKISIHKEVLVKNKL